MFVVHVHKMIELSLVRFNQSWFSNLLGDVACNFNQSGSDFFSCRNDSIGDHNSCNDNRYRNYQSDFDTLSY